jgi:hypothetical protein
MTHVKLQKDDCMPHDMLNSIAQRAEHNNEHLRAIEDESRFPTKRNLQEISLQWEKHKDSYPDEPNDLKSVKNRRTTPADM